MHSADPQASPVIDPRDLEILRKGARMTREVLQAPALEKHRYKELFLSGKENDSELEQRIRARADTVYHPVGSCKVGVDEVAVVDPQLLVVDASVIPTLIGGNTNAPTIMIAEKAADMVKAA